jgi:hypothetical protein
MDEACDFFEASDWGEERAFSDEEEYDESFFDCPDNYEGEEPEPGPSISNRRCPKRKQVGTLIK